MAEAIDDRLHERDESGAGGRVDWGRALMAGLAATVAITISMALFGMNVMKSMGAMAMGAGASTATQYAVGGLIHLMVGLFYGFVYAALVAPVRRWGALLKGVGFGLAITAIALAVMPVMAAMTGGGGAANPCNPCGAQMAGAAQGNPCNPCAAKNPCNPCAAKAGASDAAKNPCNPCAAKNPRNPCAAKKEAAGGSPRNACATAGAGNPCNPCGGGSSPYGGMVSLVNHLIFGLALAFVYGRAG